MKVLKKDYLILIVLFLANGIMLFGQDTIYTMPSAKEISALISIKIEKTTNKFKYVYHISSYKDSKQNIIDFYLEYDAKVDSILSPFDWDGRESIVRKKIISWGSLDSVHDILPNKFQGGFGLVSHGLPTIQKYYLRGYTKSLSFAEGEAPDLSQIRNWDIFENSFKGYTIGPSEPPSPFVSLDFLDTLKSYVNQAYSLKWISDKKEEDDKEKDDKEENKGNKIVKELIKYLDEARARLEKNKIKEAKKKLEEFVKKVEEYYEKSSEEEKGEKERVFFTSEAYALLKYNAEYLIGQLK